MQTNVTMTAIHQESRAVLVMQGVTNVTESSNTWTVTIGELTISIDRTAWLIITNSIAGTIQDEEA